MRCSCLFLFIYLFFDALNFIEHTFASVAKPRGVKTLPTTHAKGSWPSLLQDARYTSLENTLKTAVMVADSWNINWEEEKKSFWKITESPSNQKATASSFGQQTMSWACAVRTIRESEMDAILQNSKRKSELIWNLPFCRSTMLYLEDYVECKILLFHI